ncbi:YadA C-terminal domain-containing protein [Vibrio wakamikoensis]|uniref:YadA C-terminal domain-containing protein n=1 Tax=Vibrio wakamikoensis TaxID=2910251 RepID=UPI003D1B25A3
MKKTFITLALTSVFAMPALAATNSFGSIEDVQKYLASHDVKPVEGKYGNTDLYTKGGHHIATIKNNGSGEYVVVDQNEPAGKNGERHSYEVRVDKDGSITHIDGKRPEAKELPVDPGRNTVIEDNPNPDYDVFDAADVVDATRKHLDENNLTVNDDGQVFNNSTGEQVGQITTTKDGGAKIIGFDENGKETHISVDSHSEGQVKVKVEEKQNNDPAPLPDPKAPVTIDDMHSIYNEVGKQADTAYNTLDGKINSNSKKIAGLETEMKKMGDKMLDLEDRMDGVVATSHAVTNARPMVQNAGEFAMGVGIGAAGSKQALALGGAYQFSQNWSASTTVNYETAGKRSKSQLSAGAGVHYRFK